MAYFYSPAGNSQQFDANGNPLSGGKVYTYLAGSTTPVATYTSVTGSTSQANPIVLNTLGLPASPIWLNGGVAVKFVITDAAGVTLQTIDNISGTNDTTTTPTEWVTSGMVPTFISATSFSVPGDQTGVLHVRRRLRTSNTAGTIYSTITASSFGSNVTTVTVSNDTGALDSGISVVAYGLLDSENISIPTSALGFQVPNWLHNPDGAVYQRAVAATADDAYMDDRWYALTQTGTITPSQVSNPEDGYRYALRLTQSQAAAQRMGRAQIIEGKDAQMLRGKSVTFGGRVKLSTSANVRMAVLAWTGTEDSVTSDVVGDWTSASYTAGGFFINTTTTVVATSSTAMTAATAADVSVSGTIPSTATNIIVFYWTEATAAQNVTLDAWGLRLVEATRLVEHIRRSFPHELALCQRYYEKSFLYATAPAQNSGTLLGAFRSPQVVGAAATQICCGTVTFKVQKRAAPSVNTFNPGAANASARNAQRAQDWGNGSASLTVGEFGISFNGYSSSAASAAGDDFSIHWDATAEL